MTQQELGNPFIPCSAYDAEKGLCNGTKERDSASCCGNSLNCTFYENHRLQAQKTWDDQEYAFFREKFQERIENELKEAGAIGIEQVLYRRKASEEIQNQTSQPKNNLRVDAETLENNPQRYGDGYFIGFYDGVMTILKK